jgi:hypothetical protein
VEKVMPRVRLNEKLPLEYLTPGREYNVTIGETEVDYRRADEPGKEYVGTFGRRCHYAEYIRTGKMTLIPEQGATR